jgi:hypothetical protein
VHRVGVRRLVVTVKLMERGSLDKGGRKEHSSLTRLKKRIQVGNEKTIFVVLVSNLEFFW